MLSLSFAFVLASQVKTKLNGPCAMFMQVLMPRSLRLSLARSLIENKNENEIFPQNTKLLCFFDSTKFGKLKTLTVQLFCVSVKPTHRKGLRPLEQLLLIHRNDIR